MGGDVCTNTHKSSTLQYLLAVAQNARLQAVDAQLHVLARRREEVVPRLGAEHLIEHEPRPRTPASEMRRGARRGADPQGDAVWSHGEAICTHDSQALLWYICMHARIHATATHLRRTKTQSQPQPGPPTPAHARECGARVSPALLAAADTTS